VSTQNIAESRHGTTKRTRWDFSSGLRDVLWHS
jgi:hypothetical protein